MGRGTLPGAAQRHLYHTRPGQGQAVGSAIRLQRAGEGRERARVPRRSLEESSVRAWSSGKLAGGRTEPLEEEGLGGGEQRRAFRADCP